MRALRAALLSLGALAPCSVGPGVAHARELGDGAFVPLRDVAWAFPVTRVVATSAAGPAAARRLALGFGVAPVEWLALEGGLELGGALVRARDGSGELRAGGEARVGLGVVVRVVAGGPVVVSLRADAASRIEASVAPAELVESARAGELRDVAAGGLSRVREDAASSVMPGVAVAVSAGERVGLQASAGARVAWPVAGGRPAPAVLVAGAGVTVGVDRHARFILALGAGVQGPGGEERWGLEAGASFRCRPELLVGVAYAPRAAGAGGGDVAHVALMSLSYSP